MSFDKPRLVTELQVPELPAPVSHYSAAALLGEQVFVSGLLALDENGSVIGENDAAVQADHIFASLARVLASVGSDLGDVVKLTIYLTDLSDRGAVNESRKRAFGPYRPASTLVQVAGLIGQGTVVEIEAIAGVRIIQN